MQHRARQRNETSCKKRPRRSMPSNVKEVSKLTPLEDALRTNQEYGGLITRQVDATCEGETTTRPPSWTRARHPTYYLPPGRNTSRCLLSEGEE